MPTTPQIERHFRTTDFVRDIVIAMSEGLTVPIALAAGISGAVTHYEVIFRQSWSGVSRQVLHLLLLD